MALKSAIAEVTKASTLSRDQIADQINERAGVMGINARVTAAMLDKWSSVSDRTHNPPAHLVTILCEVVGDAGPLEALCRPLGFGLAGPRERALIQWAEAKQAERLAKARARKAEAALEDLL